MTRQKILDTIKEIEAEKGTFDLTYDEQIDRLFVYLTQNLDLGLSVELRSNANGLDYWLQTEYYSRKLGKTIIWDYDTGNFDDYDEVADYIIETEAEIEDFEERLPDLSPVAYIN